MSPRCGLVAPEHAPQEMRLLEAPWESRSVWQIGTAWYHLEHDVTPIIRFRIHLSS